MLMIQEFGYAKKNVDGLPDVSNPSPIEPTNLQ